MLRQSDRSRALAVVVIFAMIAGLTACGIKGPLRPLPKVVPATAMPPAIPNTATPPATTSPALPPPPPSAPPAAR
ncbi:MAG: lipoprotein [Casimicrobiaceae bacterium]|nr:lipoprotein [Pseudomonadota bacterium]